MIPLELFNECFQSEFGSLPIAENDEVTRKLAMLIEGEGRAGSHGHSFWGPSRPSRRRASSAATRTGAGRSGCR